MPVPFGFIESLTHAPSQLGGTPALQRGAEAMQQQGQYERSQTERERGAKEDERMAREQEMGRMQRQAMASNMAYFTLANKYAAAREEEKQKAKFALAEARRKGEPTDAHAANLKRLGVTVTEGPTLAETHQPAEEGVALEKPAAEEAPPEEAAVEYPADWDQETIDKVEAFRKSKLDQQQEEREEDMAASRAREAELRGLDPAAAAAAGDPMAGAPAPIPAQQPAAPTPQAVPPAQEAPAVAPQVPVEEPPPIDVPGELVLTDDITGAQERLGVAQYEAGIKQNAGTLTQAGILDLPDDPEAMQWKADAVLAAQNAAGLRVDEETAAKQAIAAWKLLYSARNKREMNALAARAKHATISATADNRLLQRIGSFKDQVRKSMSELHFEDVLDGQRLANQAREFAKLPNPLSQEVAIGNIVKWVQGGRPSNYDTQIIRDAGSFKNIFERLANKFKMGEDAGQLAKDSRTNLIKLADMIDKMSHKNRMRMATQIRAEYADVPAYGKLGLAQGRSEDWASLHAFNMVATDSLPPAAKIAVAAQLPGKSSVKVSVPVEPGEGIPAVNRVLEILKKNR